MYLVPEDLIECALIGKTEVINALELIYDILPNELNQKFFSLQPEHYRHWAITILVNSSKEFSPDIKPLFTYNPFRHLLDPP